MAAAFTFYGTYVALWVFVILQGLLILAILQRIERLRNFAPYNKGSIDQLQIGELAPQFSGVDQFGENADLSFFGDRGGVLLFVSPSCPACEALVSSLALEREELPPTIILCRGDRAECSHFSDRFGANPKLVSEPLGETGARYGAVGVPTAVAIDRSKRVRAYGHPQKAGDLRDLFLSSSPPDEEALNTSWAAGAVSRN
jgi:hypothetical protein